MCSENLLIHLIRTVLVPFCGVFATWKRADCRNETSNSALACCQLLLAAKSCSASVRPDQLNQRCQLKFCMEQQTDNNLFQLEMCTLF